MLSELINELITKTTELEDDLNAVSTLKVAMDSTLSEDNLQSRIDNNPYLKSNDFMSKVAGFLDMNAIVEKLPKGEVKEAIVSGITQTYNPQHIAKALLANTEFMSKIKAYILIEIRNKVDSTLILDSFKRSLKSIIQAQTIESLKANKIDKYRLEGALNLFILRLYTKASIIQNTYDEANKKNIYKRI